MPNISKIISQFSPGINMPISWEESAQVTDMVDPYTNKFWPGTILFGSQVNFIIGTIGESFTDGTTQILFDVNFNAIKYIHNGEFLNPGQSDTEMKPYPLPMMDVACIESTKNTDKFPFIIERVVDEFTILVKNPDGILGSITDTLHMHFTRRDLLPYKRLILNANGIINLTGFGGAPFATSLNGDFSTSSIDIDATVNPRFSIVACKELPDYVLITL